MNNQVEIYSSTSEVDNISWSAFLDCGIALITYPPSGFDKQHYMVYVKKDRFGLFEKIITYIESLPKTTNVRLQPRYFLLAECLDKVADSIEHERDRELYRGLMREIVSLLPSLELKILCDSSEETPTWYVTDDDIMVNTLSK